MTILLLLAVSLGPSAHQLLTAELNCLRKRVNFCGHTDHVEGVAISPDSKVLASASDDKTVKLWDAATGRERATLKGHKGGVTFLVFSPDSKTLASVSKDNMVKVWDVRTGRVQKTLAGGASAWSRLAFSPDGKTLATVVGPSGLMVTLWDVATGKAKITLNGHTERIFAVAFSPDGKTLATGSWDCTAKLWDVATGRAKVTLRAIPAAYTKAVAFSPDGKLLACGDADVQVENSDVMLWDVATGKPHKRLTIPHCYDETYIGSVSFSRDGKTLAAIEAPRTVHVWDVGSGKHTAGFGWSEDDPTPYGSTLDAYLDALPQICGGHDEFESCESVFFRRDGALIVLGTGRRDDPRRASWTLDGKLLDVDDRCDGLHHMARVSWAAGLR